MGGVHLSNMQSFEGQRWIKEMGEEEEQLLGTGLLSGVVC